jgi:hypothetical protein
VFGGSRSQASAQPRGQPGRGARGGQPGRGRGAPPARGRGGIQSQAQTIVNVADPLVTEKSLATSNPPAQTSNLEEQKNTQIDIAHAEKPIVKQTQPPQQATSEE